MRETLIKDCPKFRNWHDPCGAYYVGLNECWAEQPRNPPAAPTQREVGHAAKTEIGGQVAHDPEKPLYGFPIGARLAQQKGRASG